MPRSILVVVPTYESIATECYEALWKLTKQVGCFIDFKSVKGYDCARARNEAVKTFLDSDATHLMMVDSDIVIPEFLTDNVANLSYLLAATREYGVILGWYPRKNEPSKTELFMPGFDGYFAANRWNCVEIANWPDNFVEVKGGGFGCAIIHRGVFDKIDFPYFKYDLRDDGTYISEDLFFCNKVHDAGIKMCSGRGLGCNHIGKKIVSAYKE